MNLVVHGPFRAGSLVWQPRPGTWSLAVVIRAGFELAPGESRPVALPKTPADERSKLLEHALTLAPCKRWPEVVVVGSAHAPEGKPVTSLVARLAVGSLDKRVQVVGDRCITNQGALLGPAPFTRMPLSWERAAGGPGTSNPAGVTMGPGARPDPLGRVTLPNLVPPGASIATRHDVLPPVGFAPLDAASPMRVARLHRHAAAWSTDAWNERPLPDDFDFAYFDVAPPDQALAELSGTERIVLENLHPHHAQLSTTLAVVAPQALSSLDGGPEDVPLQIDTLVIDADLGLAQLVWRGQVPLAHPQPSGVILVSREASAPAAQSAGSRSAGTVLLTGPGAKTEMLSSEVPAATPAGAPPGSPVVATMAAFPVAPRPALPFPERPPLPRPPSVPGTNTAGLPFRPAPAAPSEDEVELLDVEPDPPASPPPPAFPHVPPPALASPLALLPLPPEPPPPEPPPPEPPPPPALPDTAATPDKPPPPAEAAAIEPEPPLPVEVYPLERCARIAASLARRPARADEILGAQSLSAAVWARLAAHWDEAVERETRLGKTALLRAYDTAYVAQLEEERGPIEPEEYARVLVAAERGGAGEALRRLDLPEGSLMRLRRVWIARSVREPALGRRVSAAIEAERSA